MFEVGRTYSWAELGAVFDFKPNYLSAAGGMIPRPSHGVLILITHPEGGKSFDYEDYWEGADLIYTQSLDIFERWHQATTVAGECEVYGVLARSRSRCRWQRSRYISVPLTIRDVSCDVHRGPK